MDVRPIAPADSADLRREVLRGGRDVPLPGDESPAHHVGVYDGPLLVATGNVREEPATWLPGEPAWRVRGMATDPAHRRRGAGALVLHALVAHVTAHGGSVVWCNARTPAKSFYQRAGLVTRGQEWVDPDIGPHVVMWRRV
jgi:GNAT superfamily N-acetyltransferase